MPYNFVLTFWNPCTSKHTEQLKQWQLRDTFLKLVSLLSPYQWWNNFNNSEMFLWALILSKQMWAIFNTTRVRQSSLYMTITFYTCTRSVSSWTNGERAVLRRSKGALCTCAYGNCGSLKCCQNRWTFFCVLGMVLKGSTELAQKTTGEVTRNSGICSDFH